MCMSIMNETVKTNDSIMTYKNCLEILNNNEYFKSFKNAIELLPVGIAVSNLEQNSIIDANEFLWKTIGGYESKEEFLMIPTSEHYYSMQDRKLTAKELLGKNGLQAVDLQLKRKDGSLIWLKVTSVHENFQSDTQYIITVAEDITDSKEAEKELQSSKNIYKTLVETMPDSVTVTDLNGKIIFVSQKGFEMYGCNNVYELIGKNSFDFISPDEHAKTKFHYKETLEKGFSKTEYKLLKKDGSSYLGEINAALIKDEEGNAKFFIGTIRDITERKEHEEILKRYESIVSASREILILIDKNYIFQEANSFALKLFNKSKEEIVGHHVSEMLGKDNFEKYSRTHFEKCFKGEICNYQFWFTLPDERTFYIDITYYPFRDNNEEITGAVVTVKNITKQKETEDALKKHQSQLEEVVSERTKELQELNKQLQQKIIEKEKIENELRESEEKYRTLVEGIGHPIFVVDKNGKFLFMNSFSAVQFKDRAENFINKKTMWDLFPPSIADRQMNTIIRVIETKTPVFVETETVLLDKKSWYETKIYPLFNDNGQVESVLAIAFDINDRKYAETKLRDSEEKYRLLSESAEDTIFLISNDMNLKYVNTVGAQLLHGRPEHFIGKNLKTFFPSSISERMESNVTKVLKTGESIHLENITEFPHGSLWLSVNLVPYKDENGNILGVMGISRDVTERKKMEESLKEEKNKLQSILDNSPVGVLVINKNFKIVHFNDTFMKMFNLYEGKEKYLINLIEETGILEIIHGIINNSIYYYKKDVVINNKIFNVTLSTSDDLNNITVIFEDITRDRELDKLKTNLLDMVSHELKTPLTSIIGYSEMLEDSIDASSEKKYCKIITNQSRKLLTMINNILDISRIEAGKIDLYLSEFDIMEILNEIRESLGPIIEEKNIKIVYKLNNIGLIKADPDKIYTVLRNLIDNAIKFSHKNGEIIIEAERVNGNIKVSVIDQGGGVPEEKAEKIWEKFYQLDNGITRKIGGIGLGLNLCKKFIELHGGSIWVEKSPDNNGSSFIFTIPYID